MTNEDAIKKIEYRIATASRIAGTGVDGKAFEDLEMAIQALKDRNEVILRPCVFLGNDGKEHKGYFHTWEQQSSGNVARMFAVIETEDGEIIGKSPYLIRFTDRKGYE